MIQHDSEFKSIIKGWIFLLIWTFVALLWTACQTDPVRDFSKIQPNMTKDEVLELIGSPVRTERFEGKEKWAYRYWVGQGGNQEALKQVTFVNGKVVGVGEDTDEEKRINDIHDDDVKRAEKRKQVKAKALQPEPNEPQATIATPEQKETPPETESDFVEQKGSK